MVVTTGKQQSAADPSKKASTTAKARRKSSGAGGRKKLTDFNKFMQTEVARLKQENPDMPHKDRQLEQAEGEQVDEPLSSVLPLLCAGFPLAVRSLWWTGLAVSGRSQTASAQTAIIDWCLYIIRHAACSNDQTAFGVILELLSLAMSQTHDIDNDDPFFPFDLYEPLHGSRRLKESVQEPQHPLSDSHDHPRSLSSSAPGLPLDWYYNNIPTHDEMATDVASSPSKGKGVSKPLYIQGREPVDIQIDVLQAAGSSSSAGNFSLAHAWSESSPSIVDPSHIQLAHFHDPALNNSPDFLCADELENVGESSGFSAKGKGLERPPVLPPLVFMSPSLDYEGAEWPSSLSSVSMSPQTAGPSSYGSGFASIAESESGQSASIGHDVTPPVSPDAPAHIPARRRSLSNISLRSTRSLSALSISKVKVKLAASKGPGNIARKLLFRRRAETVPTPTTSPTAATASNEQTTDADLHGSNSCFMPWARDLKSCTSPPQGTLIDIDVDLSSGMIPPVSPLYRLGPPSGSAVLRTKGRSYSSPFPLTSSPFDIVPTTPAEISQPIPVNVLNHFDVYLPRELRILVLAMLVDLHEADHRRLVSSGKWTAIRAGLSRNRHVGVEKGVRELLKLSRVSKAWQSLVYDGQLWARLPRLPPSVLARLCGRAGGFVKRVEFTGLADLSSDALVEMTDGLCIEPLQSAVLAHTRITTIDLHGCTALTTRSLHYLLIRSPALQTLNVKGLAAVNNRTCAILSMHCRNLISLDASRCSNLDGEGISYLASSTLERGERLRLKVLRLTWLARVTDDMMRNLGRAAPDLEVLDLSYAVPLHNSAVEAFVSLTEEEAKEFEAVQLTAREAGRDPADPTRYWRRVTRLRHLALSSCILLTDHALSHLAHAVPRLEFLELAGIGPDLRDDGLVRLLDTTPYIRRVDLEDASEITDAILAALTPRQDASANVNANAPASLSSPLSRGAPQPPVPQPGHALEHLVISYAGNVTNDALLALIRGCTRLRALEADNTRMSSAVAREFVRRARERRLVDPALVAIDCRGVGEYAVKELTPHTRPRRGWRAWEAKKLAYLDGRDEEGLGVGQDECDETRVVLKTFYSWQTVDAVRAAREKKRKAAKRAGNGSGSSAGTADADFATGRTRWWAPSGRRSGAGSPLLLEGPDGRDGCTIM
ncbi:RNI-like protein [Dichomitus squalens]|uniref:RNI-like protein n=1 Tax=Dichomitus squalens TaxID=114155 RepID=A0A4Q9MRN2_9APHY|nr:RNI-like protein [Dichomitus squalens]